MIDKKISSKKNNQYLFDVWFITFRINIHVEWNNVYGMILIADNMIKFTFSSYDDCYIEG